MRPPELEQLALNFLATFFSRHPPEQQPSFCRFYLQGDLHGALYTDFHYLSGPPLHRDRALFPRTPLVGGSGVVCAGSGCLCATIDKCDGRFRI